MQSLNNMFIGQGQEGVSLAQQRDALDREKGDDQHHRRDPGHLLLADHQLEYRKYY